jgi:hypothetical protein
MIHYALRCEAEHEFDGWFKSSAAFETQAQAGLVECPHCGSYEVTRALMAPSLSKSRPDPTPSAVPAPSAAPVVSASPAVAETNAAPVAASGPLPDHLRAMLQKLRTEVEANCDYVGSDFAAEARRIHEGDATPRAIYGETTAEEAESLAEDGVPCTAIPWVPRADG